MIWCGELKEVEISSSNDWDYLRCSHWTEGKPYHTFSIPFRSGMVTVVCSQNDPLYIKTMNDDPALKLQHAVCVRITLHLAALRIKFASA